MAAVPEPDAAGRPHRARDAGFSLVEMMVALAVFAVLGTSVGVLVADSLRTTRADQSRVRAASLSAQEIEAVRAGLRSGGGIGNTGTLTFPWSESLCAASSPTCTRTVDGQKFTLTRTVVPVAADATHAGRLQVTVSATWPKMDGVRPVVNSTVMTARGIDPAAAGDDTPGSGSGSMGTGTAAVSVTVVGSAGSQYVGKPVLLAGPTGSLLVNTDGAGTALFTGLAAATYTVSAESAGYLTPAGAIKAETSVVAPGNATTAATLQYSQAAQITYTVTAPSTYGTNANAVISAYNAASNVTKQHNLAGGTGTTTVPTWPTTSLIPWLGTCSTDKPGVGVVAQPGAILNVPMALGGVEVTVKKPYLVVLSQPLVGAELYAVKDIDAGCPAGPIDPVRNVAVGSVIKFPGVTDSNGKIKLALPPGSWRIEVKDHGLGLLSALLSDWPKVDVTAGAVTTKQLNVDGLV